MVKGENKISEVRYHIDSKDGSLFAESKDKDYLLTLRSVDIRFKHARIKEIIQMRADKVPTNKILRSADYLF